MKNCFIIVLVIFCLVYCHGWEREKKNAVQFQQKCDNYQKIVRDYQKQERVVWKHAMNLPDSFLLEFYPDAKNPDSLRAHLPIEYEHYDDI